MTSLFFLSIIDPSDIGVVKKVFYQKKALRKLGLFVLENSIYKDDNENIHILLDNEEIGLLNYSGSNIKKLKQEMVGYSGIYKSISKCIIKKNVDIIYIRKCNLNPSFLKFLQNLKSKRRNLKILIEIPTYPPWVQGGNTMRILLERSLSFFLKFYVDYIVTFSEEKTIFGIPCINITNGIDLEEIQVKTDRSDREKLVLTSVSNHAIWHGLDRLLHSLIDFIGENPEFSDKLKLNIVGYGTQTADLKNIVRENPIVIKTVEFHGIKTGNDLDEIYNQTDIGIGCLGCHRVGITKVASLKNREYAAKGLPMVFSEDDDSFSEKEFVFHCKPDESPIDILSLIEWYSNLKINSHDIRRYSEKFSWEKQLSIVIRKL